MNDIPKETSISGETSSANRKWFFLKHWHGEYPLAFSYWIICIFGGISVAIIFHLVTDWIDVAGESLTFTAWGLLIYVIGISCFQIWMVVGTWRSATKFSQTSDSKYWGYIVKFVLVSSCIQFFNTFSNDLVPYVNVTRIYLLGGDTLPELKVEVIDSGKTLKIEGYFSNGSYKKLKNMLSESVQVERLYLDSQGGRLKEVTLSAKLIQEKKLDTYVERQCMSFCTVIFLAGNKRYATPTAKLGFHSPALIENQNLGEKTGLTETSIALYKSYKLPSEFIDKIFATDNSTMWFPPFQYLVDIGVVNQISSGGESEVAGKKLGKTKESVIAYLKTEDFFRKVNSKFPSFFEDVAASAVPLLEQGKSDNEVFSAIRQKSVPMMLKAVSNSNRDIRLRFGSLGLEQSKEIAKLGGDICYKFLMSQLDISKVLPAELVKKELKIYEDALDSEFIPPANYSESAANLVFDEIFSLMAQDEVQALNEPNIKNGGVTCSAMISYYKAMNSLSQSKRDLIIFQMAK